MSNWSDPTIVVAIILGVIANLWHVVNLYHARKERRSERLWEEYRTTVVDPMRGALKDLLDPARYLMRASRRDARPDAAEWKKFGDELGWLLNAVELVCAKADRHPETLKQDWSELADRQRQRILELVDKSPDSAEWDLESVRRRLSSYDNVFGDRLREQWHAMTGVANAGLFARSIRFPGRRRS